MKIDEDETLLACENGMVCHSLFFCRLATSPSLFPSEEGEERSQSGSFK